MNESITAALADIIKTRYELEIIPELSRPDSQFGDLSTNVALRLAGQLKRAPREVAEELAESLQGLEEISSVSVAGPGFINMTLSDATLLELTQSRTIVDSARRGQVVVIETNNPNPFKDLHIGHAYNCIVADTIANLLEAGGAHVHRVSYHGDVGLHVGKSMWAIMKWLDGDVSKLETIPQVEHSKFMSDRYIEGAKAYEEDEAAKAEIETYAKQSFAPEGEYKKVYETCKDWSFDYITETVSRLGSKPVEKRYLESTADAVGVKTVRANVGEVFAESDGAVVFAGEAFGLHTRVFIASRGTGLYEARDLGLMQLKAEDFNPSKSYIVTGQEQAEYFKVVIKAAELALPALTGVTENISTGTVKLSTGKMSSRTGNVLNIEWLFEQLQAALKARGGTEHDNDTLIGALRYAMLRVRIGSDVIFDVDASLSLEGNSGPYLQYAHARARSILAKANQEAAYPDVLDQHERALALKLSEYSEVLEAAVSDLLPHSITTYLYELAQDFNRFYEHSRVIGDEREAQRVWLVRCYADTLAAGLAVLGIPAPEKL